MKGLAQKIISDKELEKKAFLYLKRQLDEETAKPSGKRDYDKIAVLTNELCELSDGLDQSSDIVGQKQRLYSKISEYNAGKNKASVRTLRKIIPIICAAAIVFAANCISVSAWNMNIFSLAVELTQGGVKIDFGNKSEEIVLPTSENDPYGIIGKCEEMDITAETPHYLPEGFMLVCMESDKNDYMDYILFTFENGSEKISLSYQYFHDGDLSNICILSDEHNISEITVCGHQAIVSKEDNQMNLIFNSGYCVIDIFTQNVDYAECDKIVNSIK